MPATVSNAEPGSPLPSQGESPCQADFFPAPLPFPPERPEPPEEEEKEALPFRFFLFLPDWPEGEDDDVCLCAGRAPEEPACPEPDADDPADPEKMESPLHKSVVRCRTQLGKRRIQ